MLHWLARPHRRTLVVAGALFAPIASALTGQTPTHSDARLQGVVMEESTYQPVDSALVTLVGTGVTATTGRWGAFALPDAPLGKVSLSVSAPGHPTVVQDVEVTNGGVVFVQVVLPSVAATLREVLVQAGMTPNGSRQASRTAADLLAEKVPRVRPNPGSVGQTDYNINLRGPSTLVGDNTPTILIDGVLIARAADAYDALLRIPASDVQEIQVLKGVDAFQYPYSANGVINVKTKRGN